jgi:hypothetical protein
MRIVWDLVDGILHINQRVAAPIRRADNFDLARVKAKQLLASPYFHEATVVQGEYSPASSRGGIEFLALELIEGLDGYRALVGLPDIRQPNGSLDINCTYLLGLAFKVIHKTNVGHVVRVAAHYNDDPPIAVSSMTDPPFWLFRALGV